MFEHFAHPRETSHFLSEALRVLAPGGRLDVGVPDTGPAISGYGDPQNEYWRLAKTIWHPKSCQTQMEHINYHFRQNGEHKYAWDAETLLKVVGGSGFVAAAVRSFDPELDLESRRLGTVFVRAQKAAN